MAGQGSERADKETWNIPRLLLIAWCCFIVYGSFIPFRFSADPEFVRSNLAQVELFPFQRGTKNFSLPDVVSNVLLFIPFGLLLATGRFRILGQSWPRRIFLGGMLALGFAAAIELGQLFASGRRSSGIDAEFDVLGALGGAAGAYLLQRYETQVDACLRAVRAEPALGPLALLALWLGSNAFYPFAVTLDVSTAWHNLTHAKWVPFRHPHGLSLDRVVDEAVMFAILSALIRSVLRRHVSAVTAAAGAVVAAIAFSIALEFGKLLVVGRLPNMENVLLASVGAVFGVTVVPLLMAWPPVRKRPAGALAALALLLMIYYELTPFAFATSSSAITRQVARIEWLPLLSYSRADAPSALFDLWKKLLLSGFWGFTYAWAMGAPPWRAASAGLVAGGALEAGQLLTSGHIPSVGDTLIFGFGAWIGGKAYQANRDLGGGPGLTSFRGLPDA